MVNIGTIVGDHIEEVVALDSSSVLKGGSTIHCLVAINSLAGPHLALDLKYRSSIELCNCAFVSAI